VLHVKGEAREDIVQGLNTELKLLVVIFRCCGEGFDIK
jgi:hypothetical protein